MDAVTGAAGNIVSSVSGYVGTHEDGIVALVLACATAVVFSGRTLLRPSVFLLGFLPTVAFFFSIGHSFLPASSDESDAFQPLPVFVLGISLAIGIAAGVVMLRLMFSLATFLLTAASGGILVLIIHILMLQNDSSNGEVILFTIVVAAALLTGFLSLAYPQTMVILGSAFDGAAIAVYALSHFLGNQPDVLGNVDAEKSPAWAVGYSISTIILGTYGSIVQLRVAAADRQLARPPASILNSPDDEDPTTYYGSTDDPTHKGLGAAPLYDDDSVEAGNQRV